MYVTEVDILNSDQTRQRLILTQVEMLLTDASAIAGLVLQLATVTSVALLGCLL